jgi:hypothetical protein
VYYKRAIQYAATDVTAKAAIKIKKFPFVIKKQELKNHLVQM